MAKLPYLNPGNYENSGKKSKDNFLNELRFKTKRILYLLLFAPTTFLSRSCLFNILLQVNILQPKLHGSLASLTKHLAPLTFYSDSVQIEKQPHRFLPE